MIYIEISGRYGDAGGIWFSARLKNVGYCLHVQTDHESLNPYFNNIIKQLSVKETSFGRFAGDNVPV